MEDTLTFVPEDSCFVSKDSCIFVSDSCPCICDSILPADSAFLQGTLDLPAEAPAAPAYEPGRSLTAEILAMGSLLVTVILLRKIVNILPSLFACVMRWKESCNLEASVKLSRDRNIIAIAMIIPFCLIVEHFRLYSPHYMEGMRESLRIASTIGTFGLYLGLKFIATIICKPKKSTVRTFSAGCRAELTFFILLTVTLLTIGGICGFAGLDHEPVRRAMLWASAAIYALFLLRTFQIFASTCTVFTAFLYLCALEIVPTGLLVGSVFVI